MCKPAALWGLCLRQLELWLVQGVSKQRPVPEPMGRKQSTPTVYAQKAACMPKNMAAFIKQASLAVGERASPHPWDQREKGTEVRLCFLVLGQELP